jgi:cytochrome c-type biogenesis protein
MPKLQALYSEFDEKGLSVLGATIDRGAAEGEVRRFVKAHGISFGILLDPDADVETRFRTLGVPESFLIDREGILRARWIGEFDPSDPEVRAEIEAVLAEASS